MNSYDYHDIKVLKEIFDWKSFDYFSCSDLVIFFRFKGLTLPCREVSHGS